MTDPVLAAAALAELTPICLALPEAGEMTFGVHRRFVVREKTFAWFQDDHHGDGMTLLITKAEPGRAETLIGADPPSASCAARTAEQDGSASASMSARSTGRRSTASSSTATCSSPPSAWRQWFESDSLSGPTPWTSWSPHLECAPATSPDTALT